jgi:hypothetical protein
MKVIETTTQILGKTFVSHRYVRDKWHEWFKVEVSEGAMRPRWYLPVYRSQMKSSFVDRKLTEYWAKVKVGMFTNSVNQTPNHQMFESFLRSALEEAIRNKK